MNSKTRHRLFIAVVVVILLAAIGAWLLHEIQVDECFDRGGVWNDQARECEGLETRSGGKLDQ